MWPSITIPPSANTTLGAGLIHRTFLTDDGLWVLQKINTTVFQNLAAIDQNLMQVSEHLSKYHPDYFLLMPERGVDGRIFQAYEGAWWRIMPFVQESTAIETATSPEQAWSAARAFGDFARRFQGISLANFQETIPEFHHLEKYALHLEAAIKQAEQKRLSSAHKAIELLNEFQQLRHDAESIYQSNQFPLRLLHHDAKLGNLLVHQHTGATLTIIDLDTIMPGKLYSDMGDLIRSVACGSSEQSENQEVRPNFVAAAIEGYRETMWDILTDAERAYLPKAGQLLTYMQAIRFLADYLIGDIYYKVERPEQNLSRALGQLNLLRQLIG
jgi:Ser/Thr protein kinase RdoA (MazF antagonist)